MIDRRPTLERILARTERLPWSGCWIWMGGTGKDGYGIASEGGRPVRAHRIMLRLVGRDPGNAWVLHSCDVRTCINPAHLRAGDGFDNMRDAIVRDRLRRGSKTPNAKLTESQVSEIRASEETLHALAERHRVGVNTIWQAKTGKKWRHVK